MMLLVPLLPVLLIFLVCGLFFRKRRAFGGSLERSGNESHASI
jgi:hypothetical protein